MIEPRKQTVDLEEQVRRQGILADFGEFALRSDDLDAVLTEACRLVAKALDTRRSKILEIGGNGSRVRVRTAVGWEPNIVGLELQMADHSSETYSIKSDGDALWLAKFTSIHDQQPIERSKSRRFAWRRPAVFARPRHDWSLPIRRSRLR